MVRLIRKGLLGRGLSALMGSYLRKDWFCIEKFSTHLLEKQLWRVREREDSIS